MASGATAHRTLQSELRSLLATLQCLADYAREQGDAQSAAILHNAAALLAITVAAEDTGAVYQPGSAVLASRMTALDNALVAA